MHRNLAWAFVLACIAVTSFAQQSRMNGKWATDPPADPLSLSDAQRKQMTAQVELTVEGANATGSVGLGGLGGTFFTFKDVRVTGNRVGFKPYPNTETTYTMELADDNTLLLYSGPLPMIGLNNAPDLGSPLPRSTPAAASAAGAPTTSISGTVRDSSRALIPGVTITATNMNTGAKMTTVTDQIGQYRFVSATQGKYTITAALPGFKTMTATDLNVDAQPLQLEITLEIGAIRVPAPTLASCTPNGIVWCRVLHRAK